MYEDFVRRLRERAAWINFPHHGEEFPTEDAMLMMQAADAIEELQQTAEHYKGCSDDWYREACDYKAMIPQWIPVTERLPEKRKWVLCRCQASITDVLRYENAEWYHDPTHVYMFDFVTHWMPLPKPPKEDKK